MAHLQALLQTMPLIREGNRISNFGSFIRPVAENADLNQAGIAHGPQIHPALENRHGFHGFERLAIGISCPYFVQIQVGDDLAEDDLRLNDFELSLDKIGIIAARVLPPFCDANNIRLVPLDFYSGSAGKALGQNESHQRSGDNNEQKHRQNDGFADANNTPIIQEMQFRFLGRRYF